MLSGTFLSQKETIQPGFKVSKDCIMAVLEGSAVGDFKLKLLLVLPYSESKSFKRLQQGSNLVIESESMSY